MGGNGRHKSVFPHLHEYLPFFLDPIIIYDVTTWLKRTSASLLTSFFLIPNFYLIAIAD